MNMQLSCSCFSIRSNCQKVFRCHSDRRLFSSYLLSTAYGTLPFQSDSSILGLCWNTHEFIYPPDIIQNPLGLDRSLPMQQRFVNFDGDKEFDADNTDEYIPLSVINISQEESEHTPWNMKPCATTGSMTAVIIQASLLVWKSSIHGVMNPECWSLPFPSLSPKGELFTQIDRR